MSLTYPGCKVAIFGLIWKIFFSRMAFSYDSSSVGSPGSAHNSSFTLLSEGNLKE